MGANYEGKQVLLKTSIVTREVPETISEKMKLKYKTLVLVQYDSDFFSLCLLAGKH